MLFDAAPSPFGACVFCCCFVVVSIQVSLVSVVTENTKKETPLKRTTDREVSGSNPTGHREKIIIEE